MASGVAVRAGDWSQTSGTVVAGGVELQEGEYDLKLVGADPTQSAPLPGGEGVVVLDSTVTPALEAEGVARDLVRVVQQARRDASLNVSDRVSVRVDGAVGAVLADFGDFVARETLAASVEVSQFDGGFAGEVGDGEPVRVLVTKV